MLALSTTRTAPLQASLQQSQGLSDSKFDFLRYAAQLFANFFLNFISRCFSELSITESRPSQKLDAPRTGHPAELLLLPNSA